jgi:hypothetical protein
MRFPSLGKAQSEAARPSLVPVLHNQYILQPIDYKKIVSPLRGISEYSGPPGMTGCPNVQFTTLGPPRSRSVYSSAISAIYFIAGWVRYISWTNHPSDSLAITTRPDLCHYNDASRIGGPFRISTTMQILFGRTGGRYADLYCPGSTMNRRAGIDWCVRS